MSHLDCVDRLRETMARVSEAQARRLNTGLELLTDAAGRNEENGKRIPMEMIITADVFSRVLRETLTETQRDEIIKQVAVTYNFPNKDLRLIGTIVDHWLAAYDR